MVFGDLKQKHREVNGNCVLCKLQGFSSTRMGFAKLLTVILRSLFRLLLLHSKDNISPLKIIFYS
jgi:hypothetical protein